MPVGCQSDPYNAEGLPLSTMGEFIKCAELVKLLAEDVSNEGDGLIPLLSYCSVYRHFAHDFCGVHEKSWWENHTPRLAVRA